jgi:hypothetical protein
MPQFRPLPSFQVLTEPVTDALEESPEEWSVTPSFPTSPPPVLFLDDQPPASTGQLAHILQSSPVTTTEPLSEVARATSASTPIPLGNERFIRIPGSRPRSLAINAPVTGALLKPGQRMNVHLRHSIVLGAVLTVIAFTLLSLAPLDNGQSVIPIFRGFSNWVHAQQAFWQLEAQIAQTPVAQSNTTNNVSQLQVPPPVNLPKSAYVSIAQQDASSAGISPDYFVRQINLESGFNPNAVSPSGAEGIAQFMPATAQGLGIDPFNPIQALNAAAHYMASYNNMYNGNYAMALAAYNAGGGTVQYAVSSCGSNWISCLPGQTQNYILVIMGI